MLRRILLVAVLGAAALPARAEIVTVPSMGTVSDTMDALEETVREAGATIFARVDHGAGAEQVGSPVGPVELLIFGNPEIGTPAMVADVQSGLFLPLKVLVYESDEGEVLLAYEDPIETFTAVSVSEDAEFLAEMSGVLQRLTNKAAVAR